MLDFNTAEAVEEWLLAGAPIMSATDLDIATLRYLAGPAKRGQGYTSHFCPVPSHNGGVLDGSKHGKRGGQGLAIYDSGAVKCYNGCEYKDILAALQANDRGTRGAGGRPPRQERPAGRKVATYLYRLQAGGTITKERFEAIADPPPGEKREKWFVWPTGTHLEDVCLFRVEDLEAADPERIVWFTEGEKACEAIRARNELATCGAWSSSQRRFGRSCEVLAGRTVIVWPDNDASGHTYRDVIRDELERVGCNVRIFQPAGLPADGGDAFDFFAAGRTLDEFKLHTAPEVSTRPDGIEVVLQTDTWPISFTFSPYGRARGELDVELAVSVLSPLRKSAYEARVNLLSQSATRDLRYGLEAQFGKGAVKWAEVIAEAIGVFRREHREQRRASVESVSATSEAIAKPELVLGQFVVANGGTFIFGPPGAGKSTLAMLWAASIDADCSTLWPVSWRRVLFVNLERSAEQARWLYSRCLAALGIPPSHKLLMLNARGRTLVDEIDTIRESIWRDGVQVVVVDSISRAGYGDLTDNQASNRASDALNSLGVTWVAIAHSPRGDNTHIFGSVMFDAAGDVMVNVVAEQDSEHVRGIQLTVTKSNHLGLPKPEMWAYEYDDDGLVEVRPAGAGQFTELDARRQVKLSEQIEQYLLDHGESDPTTVARELGFPRSRVNMILSSSPRFTKTRRDGRRQFYGVLAERQREANAL